MLLDACIKTAAALFDTDEMLNDYRNPDHEYARGIVELIADLFRMGNEEGQDVIARLIANECRPVA